VTVFAVDTCGALDSTSFKVIVQESTGTGIEAENAFSPNGDGINDFWTVNNPDAYSKCEFSIYNSIGQTVYSSIGYEFPWDGKYNAIQLPTGTYYYVVKFPDNSYKKGTIAIIK